MAAAKMSAYAPITIRSMPASIDFPGRDRSRSKRRRRGQRRHRIAGLEPFDALAHFGNPPRIQPGRQFPPDEKRLEVGATTQRTFDFDEDRACTRMRWRDFA